MSTPRNVTVLYKPLEATQNYVMATSTGIERDNIKDMKIGDRIKAYCVPVGEGYKSDPCITLDINDALDHIEKYHGKKFGTTITVKCAFDNPWPIDLTYDEGATEISAAMGFYAYKVDKGLLMAHVIGGSTTIEVLNRQNLYSGDGWRLLGPRELSKYILSDLNGTINPKVNPWTVSPDEYSGRFSFYQMPHTGTHEFHFSTNGPSIWFSGYNQLGWPNVNKSNNQRGDGSNTSIFVYQYVESENATNIYY